MSLRNLGLSCGAAGSVLWLGLIAIASALRPDVDFARDYISELAERGSATELLMRYAAFELTGFLYVCFALGIARTTRGGWLAFVAAGLIALEGAGRMGAGAFPCDPGCDGVSLAQRLHRLFATLGFSSAVLATIAWAVVFRRSERLKPLTWYSIATGGLALAFLLLMSAGDAGATGVPGLYERAATGLLSVWLLVFAARV